MPQFRRPTQRHLPPAFVPPSSHFTLPLLPPPTPFAPIHLFLHLTLSLLPFTHVRRSPGHLHIYQWLSLVFVMFGVALVGLSGTLRPTSPLPTEGDHPTVPGQAHLQAAAASIAAVGGESGGMIFIGILTILVAQLFTASQFVIEEKVRYAHTVFPSSSSASPLLISFLSCYCPSYLPTTDQIMGTHHVEPLLAVGLEGVFGFLTTLVAMPILHYFFAAQSPCFDLYRLWTQVTEHKAVWLLSLAIMLSISKLPTRHFPSRLLLLEPAGLIDPSPPPPPPLLVSYQGSFNFFGLSVTKLLSATARSTVRLLPLARARSGSSFSPPFWPERIYSLNAPPPLLSLLLSLSDRHLSNDPHLARLPHSRLGDPPLPRLCHPTRRLCPRRLLYLHLQRSPLFPPPSAARPRLFFRRR
jgi:hypothetical protein